LNQLTIGGFDIEVHKHEYISIQLDSFEIIIDNTTGEEIIDIIRKEEKE
jgi:hypothetical protein